MEHFAEHRPGEWWITTSTTVTLAFDDNIPDVSCACICDPMTYPTVAEITSTASVTVDAARDSFEPSAPPPPSPAPSLISIASTLDSVKYLSTFNSACDSLDVTGLQLCIDRDDNLPLIMPALSPTSTDIPLNSLDDMGPQQDMAHNGEP